MTTEQLCSTCGKKIRTGRSGSLTQWLFTEDSCECGGKRASLKMPEIDRNDLEVSRMCDHCGKLKSDSRQGSLTQWVFGSERCSCDFEKLKQQSSDESGEITAKLDPLESPAYVSDIDSELIEELENGEIKHHGLNPDSFPFNRYRIISEKGRGQSGIVYESWDCLLKKRVAIKTLYSQVWSPDDLMRFQSEARATSRLSHRNVLQVLDFGAADNGQPYMVMEFVNGTTLKELIDHEGSIESVDAVPLFLQICEGVRHAHKHEILHRDLKSSNIMIGTDGTGQKVAKVIDFGIAALTQGQAVPLRSGESQNETIVGSPLYMSPDQINGLQFDARSEIYSFGCVMYETLCGKVPYEADTAMATMALHARAEIPDLINTYGEPVTCPEELAAIVRKSLAKEPESRFKSMEHLERHLIEVSEILGLPPLISSDDENDLVSLKRTPFERYKTPITVVGVLFLITGIGVMVYKLISALPAPSVVPSTSELELFDKAPTDAAKRRAERRGPFEDLNKDGMSVTYSERQGFLTIEGVGSADAILERALEQKLRIVDLEMTDVTLTPEGFQIISKFKSLDSLCLSDVQGFTKETWGDLEACTTLGHLRLTDVKATEEFMKIVSNLKNLHRLEMDASEVSATGLSFITSLPINYLSLKTSKLTSAHVKEIVKLKNLASLFIGDTGISDADVKELSKLPELGNLGLNGLPLKDDTLLLLGKKLPLTGIYIFRCEKLTRAGVKHFQMIAPRCSIINEDSDIKNSLVPTF